MGKQKNRLTATKTLSDPARTTTVCPPPDLVVAAANGSSPPFRTTFSLF
jgi:hypothetical protein